MPRESRFRSDDPSLVSDYYDIERVAQLVEQGAHRVIVGWPWEEVGEIQFELLQACGLRPFHKFLDIGCGSLRGGIHFVRYLQAGNYFGCDLNQSLLDAGYDRELRMRDLQDKLPKEHLLCDANFHFEEFGQTFDYALAYSLFTHLPLNHIRMCIEKLVMVMKPGSVFIATFFEAPDGHPLYEPVLQFEPDGFSHGAMDFYHYRFGDFVWLAETHGLAVQRISGFELPRNQRALRFEMPAGRMTGKSRG